MIEMIFPKNKSSKLSMDLFQNPTVEYRGMPFWSWNCKLKKGTIEEQLKLFKEMGFGGVVIHPRDGLDTEYLGDEFMDMVKYTVERCREKGLIVWIYDDDRFPSGAADGLVTQNPHFRARQLRLTKERLSEEYCVSQMDFEEAIDAGRVPRGYYCTAFSIELADGKLSGYRRLHTEDEVEDARKNNENLWFAYLELQEEAEWFQGLTYSDTMNPEAVDKFIEVTHERYKNVLGEDFGTVAPAIFTDEPRIGKQNEISYAESGEDVWIPYTDYLAKCYLAKYGEDILDTLPEYVWDRQDGDLHYRYLYRDMTTECFSTAFMDKICAWCKENGVLMTGHILGEESLRSQTMFVGDAMRTYKNMDIPGVDILIDGRELSTVKQAASVAAQYGREAVMSELYGVTNWDCTFKTYKLQGDWQAALGITIRIPHLSHMSLEGEAKRDWPGSIFYQAPWYREFSYLEDHFARLNTVLTRGRRMTKIAVVHPVESMWVVCGPEDLNGEKKKKLNRDFADLTAWLLYNTLDFDYLSEMLLPNLCEAYCRESSVESQLMVGQSTYDLVIVPNMLTIRDTTLDILECFVAKGGKVVFMGDIPQLVYGSGSNRPARFAEQCICIPNEKEYLLDVTEPLRDVKIQNIDGTVADNLFYQLREDGECRWLFVSHVNKVDAAERENYIISIKGEYTPTLFDTMNGELMWVAFRVQDGWTEFEWKCYSEDSVLLRLDTVMIHSITMEEMDIEMDVSEKCDIKVPNHKIVQKLEDITSFNRIESNVLLLDYAHYSVDGSEIQECEEILRVDNHIRARLGFTLRNGRDRQPWATEEKETHKVTLHYEIDSEIEVPVQLGIENPQKCCIFLNEVKADNTAVEWFVDKSIKVIWLPPLRKGQNELRIEIPYNQKTMLENMYLLGDFDVRLDGRKAVITEKCNKLNFGDITKQGMPFYTGNLEYVFEVEIKKCAEYFIRISAFSSPVLGVSVDDNARGLIAYTPHRLSLGELDCGRHTIKVILFGNRFNAFGMLHNANENYVWYGNGSYRTTGEDWTDDYMLRPVGIMTEVDLEMLD